MQRAQSRRLAPTEADAYGRLQLTAKTVESVIGFRTTG